MVRRDVPEQIGLDYSRQGVPPRRSATAEQLRARQQAQQAQQSQQAQQPARGILRPGYAQRPTLQDYPPANPGRAGYHAGLHPEDAPYDSQDIAFTIDEEEVAENAPRAHTSAVRYTSRQDDPKRTRNINEPRPTRRLERARVSGVVLVCLGIVLFVMIAGWFVLSFLGSWWQTTQDDWRYGRPRTFQVDAVVGHSDSPEHPSHFLAINLNRQVLVIELPGGNPAKARVYLGPILVGDGQELTPVTLSFEEGAHSSQPNMYLHIGDQVIVFLNDGQKFVAPPPPH